MGDPVQDHYGMTVLLPSRHPDNAPGQDPCLSRKRDVRRIVSPYFRLQRSVALKRMSISMSRSRTGALRDDTAKRHPDNDSGKIHLHHEVNSTTLNTVYGS